MITTRHCVFSLQTISTLIKCCYWPKKKHPQQIQCCRAQRLWFDMNHIFYGLYFLKVEFDNAVTINTKHNNNRNLSRSKLKDQQENLVPEE